MNTQANFAPEIGRAWRWSLGVGTACLVLLAAGAVFAPIQFFRSYLLAYVFWIGMPLGCIAVIMLHHLTGGSWGFGIRRLLESGSRTLPAMALLFVPLLFGLPRLYTWAQPAAVAADTLLQYKRPYLNPPFFLLRAAIYFSVWLGLGYFLNRWSREQNQTQDAGLKHRLRTLSGPGLVLYGLTLTFASVDWVMSIEPHWFSTIYGMLFAVVQALAALSLVVAVLPLVAHMPPLRDVIQPQLLNDLGNLLLAFVMLWAYLAFSQFLIIWSGNLKDEIPWYTSRARGGWAVVAVILLTLHFGVPFLLLLSRGVKRRLGLLATVASGLVVLTAVDVYWLMVPGFLPNAPQVHWMDLLALFGMGSLWFALFLHGLRRGPLVPLHDPEFNGVVEHGH
jgi:hypothetical protein